MNIKNVSILKTMIIESNEEEKVEDIDVLDAKKAYINARNMQLVTIDDYFLFFASINLLNAYVKKDYIQNKKYNFKRNIVEGLESLIKNNIKDIKFSYNKELVIIEIEGLQFSFHFIEMTDLLQENKDKYPMLEWSGIRLQPQASTIFSFANSLDNLTKKTYFGEDLEKIYLESELFVSKDNPNILEIFV